MAFILCALWLEICERLRNTRQIQTGIYSSVAIWKIMKIISPSGTPVADITLKFPEKHSPVRTPIFFNLPPIFWQILGLTESGFFLSEISLNPEFFSFKNRSVRKKIRSGKNIIIRKKIGSKKKTGSECVFWAPIGGVQSEIGQQNLG